MICHRGPPVCPEPTNPSEFCGILLDGGHVSVSSPERSSTMKSPRARPLLSPAAVAVYDLIYPENADVTLSLPELASRLTQLDVSEAMALGFSFASPRDNSGHHEVLPQLAKPGGLPPGLLSLVLSPLRTRRAVQHHDDASNQIRLWIDATEVPLPSDNEGRRMVADTGTWVDECVFTALSFAPEHPLQDFSRPPGTGAIRGLFVYDASAGKQRLALPANDELWTSPLLQTCGKQILLYANREALRAGTVAREWTR